MALPNFMMNQPQENTSHVNQNSGLDSITLGQLKAMVGSAPKPKQSWYDFRYDDEDTVMNEIEEFYSYVEMPQVAENLKAWDGSFAGEWTKATHAQRKAHVDILLESLEHRDAEVRFTNARRLFYVLQGTFAETTSAEHQLHWIVENSKIVRAANGVSAIVEAMKIASAKHDLLSNLTDAEAARYLTPSERADFMEEVTTEISVYLGMLYHLVEVLKGHDDFADELMSLDPPLPVHLFHVVAGLRDKSAKGYPIKKLLLVLWKSLLATCGGIREISRVKKLARELAGLPIGTDEALPIKSSPMDIDSFRQETSSKYPTFTPPQQPAAPIPASTTDTIAAPRPIYNPPTSKLARAYSPIPIRHHYHHDDVESHPAGLPLGSQSHPFHAQQQSNGMFRPGPQPATPAPSPPPPSPKPKKQQFQTDPNRPFLFPFSRAQGRNARLVPFAIDEADRLYNKHMYVSLSLLQMWRTREDCMTAESGLEHMPGNEKTFQSSTFVTTDPDETSEPLPDVALLNTKIEEADKAIREADSLSAKRKGRERREDLMRLKRVEQIYGSTLVATSGWVPVLLKLLLATVSAGTGIQPPQSSTSSVFPPGVASPAQELPPAVPPTLDDIDITRHREITSKAVSAILLLLMKWFRVSHVMKFHLLGQHLLDTNCLLLLLKMFGMQEVTQTVVSKADSPENNFFQFCLLNFSRNPQIPRPEDNPPRSTRHTIPRMTLLPNGQKHEEEVEMLTEFSWRNFFALINFAKIMQKLSKNRSHRIWMLVQYKSSAVLKRVLRVAHPMLQLHILKLIKSQVPFCGRKWRTSNMKVITSIYLNCRPDLRDEWLTGTEVDDVSDAQAQEQALRHLIKFYNNKRYGSSGTAGQHGALHRRSGSMSHHIDGLHPGPELAGLIRPLGTPNVVDADVFPPSRSSAQNPSIFLPYIPEDIAFEEEYEEYLSDLGWTDSEQDSSSSSSHSGELFGGTSAWHRLPSFAEEMADGISDSESVVSIGDLGDDSRIDLAREGEERESVDENTNNWEHMSPKTMALLPKSPGGKRRASSGGGLRPVLPFGLDDSSAVDLDDIEEPELGPVPRDTSSPFPSGAGVDEVEYAYGV
ncbi:hypothetical protein HGRIS_009925 [Hohenbuehelia grisea]|uniref:N1221-domain-containing protein n=1 Tax=Hohenbuehelia grisea TaxID=104357 RepID=A0ABR3J2M8_9AGAR